MTRFAYFEQAVAYDRLLERHEDAAYSEYIVNTGGDVYQYRVYGDHEGAYEICCK